MDYSVLENSTLFHGIKASELRKILESVPHHIQVFDKGECIFHLMENADKIGVILEGRVEAQKLFPNGSQINVTTKGAGELTGPAAVFSKSHKYPCDIIATEASTLMMFKKEDLLYLMQQDVRILENFTTAMASITYMLQQRIELFSYKGIAQKVAFYLLVQKRKTGKNIIPIPNSMTQWSMLMNVSRTSLHRELKRLEEEGILEYASKEIRIVDDNKLQDLLSN
ncbi:Crp/Fnr family transcriptional regulator [Lachnospira multipara]|jgi:CRP-like cAMP-binding protein|uniref:Crp/Fnr family transcriptional regulator n=1 Tax=Lachnospira multipara TaxID=28051 RepID=UPI0004804487|nr:Crp/Fnr family transcriptional regulator [Lachnospira multipara]